MLTQKFIVDTTCDKKKLLCWSDVEDWKKNCRENHTIRETPRRMWCKSEWDVYSRGDWIEMHWNGFDRNGTACILPGLMKFFFWPFDQNLKTLLEATLQPSQVRLSTMSNRIKQVGEQWPIRDENWHGYSGGRDWAWFYRTWDWMTQNRPEGARKENRDAQPS